LYGFAPGRRHLRRSAAAWVSGVAAFAAAQSAGAWQVEEVESARPLGLAYTKHCSGPSDRITGVAFLADRGGRVWRRIGPTLPNTLFCFADNRLTAAEGPRSTRWLSHERSGPRRLHQGGTT